MGIPTDTLLSALVVIPVTVCREDRPQSDGRSDNNSQQSVSIIRKVAQFTADVVGDGNRFRGLVVDKNDRYFSPEYFFPVYVPVRLKAMCFTKRKSVFSITTLSRFSTLVLTTYPAALCGFN